MVEYNVTFSEKNIHIPLVMMQNAISENSPTFVSKCSHGVQCPLKCKFHISAANNSYFERCTLWGVDFSDNIVGILRGFKENLRYGERTDIPSNIPDFSNIHGKSER